ncbi:hypothetical protein [Tenacibaculum jejuense]|uniref:Uncharacterized protein n=1 Tax=Tenacibaculum jejuense TaxID=584609 RepID=A0A238UCD3_9FLAO|nr:hypothetical protein [Tenacibaculum jejuense]SNR16656.1 protein of unknown function [Tenacibaculum jejuense]
MSKELFKSIVENGNSVPSSLNKIFFSEFNKSNGNELSDFIDENFPITIDNQSASIFSDLQQKYTQHQKHAYINRQILEANSELIKYVVGTASVPAAATGVGAIVVGGVNLFMDKLLDHALDEFDQSVKNSSAKIVGVHLREVRNKTGKSLEEISGMDTKAAHKLLFESNIGIMDNSIEFLTPEDRTKALHEMTKILEDKLVHATALNKLVNETQDIEIANIKDEIDFISKVQNNHQECIENITENIETIQQNFINLSESVKVLHSEVSNNSENIDILKNHVFSNANVDQKIKLLDSGLLDQNLTSEKKDQLEKQLKALKAKQDLQSSIHKHINKARHITTILSNVGFDSKTVQKANELINIGTTAMNAFTAYSSGNVLASAAIVSGLFGGKGKSDPAAQRHKQIMDKLNVLDNKLTEVLNNQITIMKNQQFIIDTLGKISKQIDELHAIEMEKLEEIKTETLYNRLSNLELQTRDLNVLETFSKPFKKFRAIKNRSYNDIQQFFFDYGDRFEKHNDIFKPLLNIYSHSLDRFLQLKEYEYLGIKDDNSINEISIITKGFDRIINYIENFTSIKNQINLFGKITINNVYHLDSKFETISKIEYYDDEELPWGLTKSSLIFTKQLERIFEILNEVHIFYLLQKTDTSESELLSTEDFFAKRFHKRKGYQHFQHLLILVNIAITQQNLLSGDKLLEVFYQRLFIDKIDQETPEHKQIITVLNSNGLFKSNFAKYFIKKQLEKERKVTINGDELNVKFDFFEYNLYLANTSSYAQDIRNKTNLRMCFDDNLQSQIIYHKGQWKLDLHRDDREAYLELPKTTDFKQGAIRFRREMYALLELKSKILDKISEYELKDFINPNENIYQHLKFN